jgi:hypothetical protein
MKRPHSYAPTQKKFEWKRAKKLNMLERLTVACGCRVSGKRFCHCGMLVKSLLKALDGFARDHKDFAVTVARLAESMGASRATVKRAIAKAVSLKYLTVTPGDGAKSPAPGRAKSGTRSTYEIQWLKIWNETEESQPNAASRENEPRSNENEPRSTMSHEVAQTEPPVPPPTNTTNKRPPPPTREPDPVVVAVVEARVAKAAEAVAAARANGMSDQAILDHVRHFTDNPDRWGPGALAKRLQSPTTPFLAPDQGWPPELKERRPVSPQAVLDVDAIPDSDVRRMLPGELQDRFNAIVRARGHPRHDPEIRAALEAAIQNQLSLHGTCDGSTLALL